MTPLEKNIRKNNKKIRKLKLKDNWDMKKIGELEDEVLMMKNIIRKKKEQIQAKEEKNKKENEMTSEQWMKYFEAQDKKMKTETKEQDHRIPNTRETRLKRKEIIQKLNEDMLSKHMENQIKIRMGIVNQIKKEMENSSGESSSESSDEEKEFEKIRSEMYSHFETV